MTDEFIPDQSGGYIDNPPPEPTEKAIKELTTPKNIDTMTDMFSDTMLNLTHSVDVIADHFQMPTLKKHNKWKKNLLVSRERKGRGELVDSLKADLMRKQELEKQNALKEMITK